MSWKWVLSEMSGHTQEQHFLFVCALLCSDKTVLKTNSMFPHSGTVSVLLSMFYAFSGSLVLDQPTCPPQDHPPAAQGKLHTVECSQNTGRTCNQSLGLFEQVHPYSGHLVRMLRCSSFSLESRSASASSFSTRASTTSAVWKMETSKCNQMPKSR